MAVFNRYTGDFSYTSPDLRALGFDWPELVKVDAEIRRLGALHTETTGEVSRLSQGRQDAEQRDAAEYAKALRAGKDDPGRGHAKKLEVELEQANRRRRALEVALQDLDAERAALIAKNRGQWRAEVENHLPEARAALREAVAALQTTRSRLNSLQGLAAWLAEPTAPYEPQDPPRDTFVVIQNARRETVATGVDGALSQLLREAQDPAESGAA